jgi:hypothetical protein
MWVELASGLFVEAAFAPPVGQERIDAADARLGGAFPDDLRALLSETDGVRGEFLVDVVWEVERIVGVNLEFRSRADFAGLYAPFDGLLFFGDNGGGDQFAFAGDRVGCGSTRPTPDARSPTTCATTWRHRSPPAARAGTSRDRHVSNFSYSRSAWSRCCWFRMRMRVRVRSRSSWRQVRIRRSMIAFIRGTRTPLRTTLMPTSARMPSNSAGHLLSRSRIRRIRSSPRRAPARGDRAP